MNKDCIFYTEIQDMHATISQCRRSTKFADCPCRNDCEHYIPIELARSVDIKPVVDAKPVVKGEWIYDSPHGVPHCSNCGEVSVELVFGRSDPNFCSNCGADMRRE